MILTRIKLSRTFVHRVGFTEAVREAATIPSDPELLRIFQKIAPNVDWANARSDPRQYQPPRWLGYWKSQDYFWASDGALRLMLRKVDAMGELFETIGRAHYRPGCELPFCGGSGREPTHMVLHDSEMAQVHVASFEQGEAQLSRQPRVPW